MAGPSPPVTAYRQPMSHAKAIEILTLLRNSDDIDITQDEKAALVMAVAALIADKLNIERG